MKNRKKKQRKVGGRVVEMEDEVVGLACPQYEKWLFVLYFSCECNVQRASGLLSVSFRQPV